MFHHLFCDIDGHSISSQARAKLNLSSSAYVYGEILPDTFQTILEQVKPTGNEVFYDLGSGVGKAVLWAAIAFPFKKAIGIEFLEDIHASSKMVLKKYQEQVRPLLPPVKQTQIVDFVQGDFCLIDLSEADVIFTHATCFSDDTMALLIKKLSCLKPGARVITVTKTLSSPAFRLVHSQPYKMSWGDANIYVYKRESLGNL